MGSGANAGQYSGIGASLMGKFAQGGYPVPSCSLLVISALYCFLVRRKLFLTHRKLFFPFFWGFPGSVPPDPLLAPFGLQTSDCCSIFGSGSAEVFEA